MNNKRKLKFVKLTISYTYYGVGKTKEEAKDFAFNEFVEHASSSSFIDDGEQHYKNIKNIDETNLDLTFVEQVLGNGDNNE